MTTRAHPAIVIEPSGLVTMCAWCLTPAALAVFARTYTISHGLCDACEAVFDAQMDARASADDTGGGVRSR